MWRGGGEGQFRAHLPDVATCSRAVPREVGVFFLCQRGYLYE